MRKSFLTTTTTKEEEDEPSDLYNPTNFPSSSSSSPKSSEESFTTHSYHHLSYLPIPLYISQPFRRSSLQILKPSTHQNFSSDRLIKRHSKMLDKSLLKVNNGSNESFKCCGDPSELVYEKELDVEISQSSSNPSKPNQNEETQKEIKKEIRIANFYEFPNKSIKLIPKDHHTYQIQPEETFENIKQEDDEESEGFDDTIFWEGLKLRNQREEETRKCLTNQCFMNSFGSVTIKCESPTDIKEKIKSPRLSILHITQSNSPDQPYQPVTESTNLTTDSISISISTSTKSSLNPIPESPSPPNSPTQAIQIQSSDPLEKPKRNGMLVIGGLSIRTKTLISFEKDSHQTEDEKLVIRRVSLPLINTSSDSHSCNPDEKSLKSKRKALCFRSH
ncbi:uncharacterized protein MELLADRAFT_108771 [Melampsora larici-populina 98AG31]|uniref:Uncharacterized protein n=1 Tax=Melampsora larici-populina (strain 98AG31 / pathotype 3-4-7) TaxID=747676 RepID=F4RU71_MELLP|nr:uncharacterized protein MELLADRAFT_108771 [Melampsora larici-populina 98AG31]EGG04135.1 hypothetical protein MELLADRAFT_108771 [Melampsora larici-populina 98AG31]